MRRSNNRPFSIPRPGASSSWKRTGDGQFPASSQCKSTGLIDERLIEGAQGSSSRYNLHRQEPPSYQVNSTSPTPQDVDYEEDMQLDAFDLELLAQSDGRAKRSHPPSTAERFLSYQPRQAEPSTQVSRFFNDSQATPHRSLASSSSDIDTRGYSSPLAKQQTGRTGGILRDWGFEAQSATRAFKPASTSSGLEGRDIDDDPSVRNESSTLFENLPVSIRGIVLLSVRELPDQYRELFHFPVFNAVQSKCFPTIYKGDDNMVLAAPTGSGKTVIMELAICRLRNTLKDEQFKVVYQAPTKSLCAERYRDWTQKFHSLGLQCAELTGDTDNSQLRNVQNSQIIITTPEKWDSMTRKWKDHLRLMQLVKLFLIDEVHTLKEARGATLEAVVSRMKSNGSNVRFVALSATIPNSGDIATWLGRSATAQHVPAHREHFGEEFRPVKLQKFVYGYQSTGNDFAFDKLCNSKLQAVIGTHSARKPIMIFCCTRNSAVTTAKHLARLWDASNPPARMWKGTNKSLPVSNTDLRTTTAAGVAFHHAGLDTGDRHKVETAYLDGKINIICCTSTLAVGVNLPCHLVIIKNTVGWQDGRCQEYSDLEVMQMLGRAGRPQFDDSATAVILTMKERVAHYEKLVSGSESLESCLHLNLIDHLNAEIGLGNVTSIESAANWIAGTFLFVRLRRNPTHYKLKEGANRDDEDVMLRQICEKDIKLLQECQLVTSDSLKSTPFGEAMARYYIRFETMKILLALKPKSDIAQILSAISQAEELKDIRLKSGEKSLYKEINRASDIKFPINVDMALPAHKISLLIQAELGAVEFPGSEQFQKHRFAFQQDKNFVFNHVNRLIRCVIDCQVHLEDSVTVCNALELARSLSARVWDNSPLQMKQIEQIGIVAVRKLAAAGIDSIEVLEETEPHEIDMALSKNPPFGMKLKGRLSEFPKPCVVVKMDGKDIKFGHHVKVRFKAEVAFMNENCPSFFQKRPVYVCFVAETSIGRLIDFRRISASKLQKACEILLSAELKYQDEYITCHIMCDEIAGTARRAVLKPDLPRGCLPRQSETEVVGSAKSQAEENGSVEGTAQKPSSTKLSRFNTDELFFGEWLESDILDDWNDKSIELDGSEPNQMPVQRKGSKNESSKPSMTVRRHSNAEKEPERLENGHWACNHKCKEKSSCKHLCCREGLTHPPKVARKKSDGVGPDTADSNQLMLSGSITKKYARLDVAPSAGTQQSGKIKKSNGDSTTPKAQTPLESAALEDVPPAAELSSDYGDESFDDLPSPSQLFLGNTLTPPKSTAHKTDGNGHDENAVFDIGNSWPEANVQSPLQESNGFKESYQVNLVSPEPQETPSMAYCFDGSGVQKRKQSGQGGLNPSASKRTKTRETCQTLEDKPFSKCGEVFAARTKDCETEACPKLDESAASSSVPAGWEDIDPALLDEFKDLVEFY
ncbi:Sec63 Brl domain-containing protein [Aspergillus karnatakaensis]|uniref:putative DEAD/DEAH box DNA helicase (Mer3) n=1 Tax=Aspergillus karnatakaensis TaxID=1810916 RepID=UPI003CCC9DDD